MVTFEKRKNGKWTAMILSALLLLTITVITWIHTIQNDRLGKVEATTQHLKLPNVGMELFDAKYFAVDDKLEALEQKMSHVQGEVIKQGKVLIKIDTSLKHLLQSHRHPDDQDSG